MCTSSFFLYLRNLFSRSGCLHRPIFIIHFDRIAVSVTSAWCLATYSHRQRLPCWSSRFTCALDTIPWFLLRQGCHSPLSIKIFYFFSLLFNFHRFIVLILSQLNYRVSRGFFILYRRNRSFFFASILNIWKVLLSQEDVLFAYGWFFQNWSLRFDS